MRILFISGGRQLLGGGLVVASLALPGRALAQVPDSTSAPVVADTAAAPVVAPSSSGASGLPSAEFETYT